MTVRAGSRKSQLARWQTDHVLQRLQDRWDGLTGTVVPFDTVGDLAINTPLPEIGGKGLFTAELEQALHDGRIDLAVHSLKDLPTASVPGLTLGAVLSRADVRDALVGAPGLTLATLPQGAVVGTSSHRRAAQLRHHRPDLQIRSIRGNVPTRIAKVQRGDYDAAVMAAAGLIRLGLGRLIAQYFDAATMLPAPGQGVLAVQCRSDDERVLGLLAPLDEPDVRAATTAERTFLAALQAGCSFPVGALATSDDGCLSMTGLVASLDGQTIIRVSGSGTDAAALGQQLAEEAFAHGAAEVMAHG